MEGEKSVDSYFFLPETKKIDWFEYWQKFIYVERQSIPWYVGLLEAYELNLYGLWAVQRFSQWGSCIWARNDNMIRELNSIMNDYRKTLRNLTKVSNNTYIDSTTS